MENLDGQISVTYIYKSTSIQCDKVPEKDTLIYHEYIRIIENAMVKVALDMGIGVHTRYLHTENFGTIIVKFTVTSKEAECTNCGAAV